MSGGPETLLGPKARIIVPRWLSRLHLLQRHALLDHILNAVANDGGHVAKFDDIGFIAQPPVAGNHISSGFLLRNRAAAVDREAQVIAYFWPRNALRLILVKPGGSFSRRIHLCDRRAVRKRRQK